MITERIVSIFKKDKNNNRPVFAEYNSFYKKEGNELLLFHEYFEGNTFKCLGAAHQTRWTALILNIISE